MEKKHELIDNAAEKRYEFDLGGDLAMIEYIKAQGFIVLTHTEVPEKYEGQGIGSELTRAVLEDLRAKKLPMIPQCPFVAQYIYRHPEWVIVHALRDAGLLEDNLGEPYAVRIAGASPRQIAAVPGVPVQQYVGNVVHILSAKVAIFPFRLYI